MKEYQSSTNSHFQSIITKSSNSSVTSILREPSPNRPKKQNNVRFDDSPTVSTYSENIFSEKLSISCLGKQGSTQHPLQYLKPVSSSLNRDLDKKSPNKSPKISPIKSTNSKEISVKAEERKGTPKVINFPYRNKGFYDKLNRYYGTEKIEKETERIFIKLDVKEHFQEASEMRNSGVGSRLNKDWEKGKSKGRVQTSKNCGGKGLLSNSVIN